MNLKLSMRTDLRAKLEKMDHGSNLMKARSYQEFTPRTKNVSNDCPPLYYTTISRAKLQINQLIFGSYVHLLFI